MADKFMYTPNDDTQNYPFCKFQLVADTLNNQPIEPNNQNSSLQSC